MFTTAYCPNCRKINEQYVEIAHHLVWANKLSRRGQKSFRIRCTSCYNRMTLCWDIEMHYAHCSFTFEEIGGDGYVYGEMLFDAGNMPTLFE